MADIFLAGCIMNTPNAVSDFDKDEGPPPPPPTDHELTTTANNDSVNDSEFIASMIPPPWERHFDHEENRHFFYNPINGDCLWETESVLDALFKKLDHMKEQQQQQSDDHDLFDLAAFEMEMDSAMTEATNNSVYTGISNSNLSVIDRSNITLQSKQQKILAIQQARDVQEQQSMQSQPQLLTKKSQSMTKRSVEDMLAWEEERQQRLLMNAQRVREEEAMQLTGRPILTSLAHTNHSDNAVEQRLLKYEQKRQVKLAQRREEQDRIAKEMSHPTLAPFSLKLAAMAADQSIGGASHVSERLYSLRRPIGESNGNGSNGMEQLSVGRLSQHDPITGQRLFEPKVNPTSEILAHQARDSIGGGGGGVEEQLLSMGQRYQQRLLDKQRRVIAEETRLRQLSKVNPRSEKLLQRRSDTTQERLQLPIGSVKTHIAEELTRLQPSFKPTISEGSKAILQENLHYRSYFQGDNSSLEEEEREGVTDLYSGQFLSEAIEVPRGQTATLLSTTTSQQRGQNRIYQRTMAWAKAKQQRQEIERARIETQLRQECSFQPFTTTNTATAVGGAVTVSRQPSGSSNREHISYRHGRWLQQKEEKLAIQRQQRAMDEVKDCTFVPKVPIPGQEIRKAISNSSNRARSRSRSTDRSAVRTSSSNHHHVQRSSTIGSVSISSGGYSDGSSSQDLTSSPYSTGRSATSGRFTYRSAGGGGVAIPSYNSSNIPVSSRLDWLRDPDLYSSDFESLEQLAQMQIQSPPYQYQQQALPPIPPSQNNNYYGAGGGLIPITSTPYYAQQPPPQQKQQQQQHLLWQQQQPRQLLEPNDDDDDDLTAPSQAVDLI